MSEEEIENEKRIWRRPERRSFKIKQTIFSIKSAVRFRGQKSEGPEKKGREARKDETSGQRYDPSSSNERGSGKWTLSTKKRKRRKQSKHQKQKLEDNPAILKAEQKFGGSSLGWEFK